MKLNNKGFTLVEVLAVVVILSLLVIMVVPNVNSLIKQNNNNAYNNLKDNILVASKIYLSDNRYDIVLEKTCNNDSEEINIKSIDGDGLVDSKLPIKYLTNSGNITTTSNGNIISPLDSSLHLDLNNSYVLIKYQCSIGDYTYILEEEYLVWK